VFSEAIYLRAHKQERFLVNSIVGAVLMLISSFVLGKYFGSTGMVSGYLAVTTLVGLGFGTSIFFKYRRIWHAE
jgi:hypothetical protein